MIPLGKDGLWDLEAATFEQLQRHFAAHILEGFVERGGKGLRDALWDAMNTTLRWNRAQDEKAKREASRPEGCECDPKLPADQRCGRSWIRCNGSLAKAQQAKEKKG